MVTHAITVKGELLGQLLVAGVKYIENRNFSLGNDEMIAISVGKQEAALEEVANLERLVPPDAPLVAAEPSIRGHIIGVIRISHTLPSDQCTASCWADTRWKKCNIISEAARLATPIPASGNLGKWKLPDDVKGMLDQQLDELVFTPTIASQHFVP